MQNCLSCRRNRGLSHRLQGRRRRWRSKESHSSVHRRRDDRRGCHVTHWSADTRLRLRRWWVFKVACTLVIRLGVWLHQVDLKPKMLGHTQEVRAVRDKLWLLWVCRAAWKLILWWMESLLLPHFIAHHWITTFRQACQEQLGMFINRCRCPLMPEMLTFPTSYDHNSQFFFKKMLIVTVKMQL